MIGTYTIYSSQGMTIAHYSSDLLIATNQPLQIYTIDTPVIPYLSSTHDANIDNEYNTSTTYDAYKCIIFN